MTDSRRAEKIAVAERVRAKAPPLPRVPAFADGACTLSLTHARTHARTLCAQMRATLIQIVEEEIVRVSKDEADVIELFRERGARFAVTSRSLEPAVSTGSSVCHPRICCLPWRR
eukprot:COSAG01_NODE_11151_length_1995_cov_16.477321_2_plen_115_part_00